MILNEFIQIFYICLACYIFVHMYCATDLTKPIRDLPKEKLKV